MLQIGPPAGQRFLALRSGKRKLMKNPHATGWMVVVYALALAVGTSYAAAQSKGARPSKPTQESAASPGPKAPMRSCPMDEAGPIADVQVENTTDGVVIRLKAKTPSDVQRVQRMAAMMAEHMSGEGTKGMHGGMQHGGMHGARRSSEQSTPKPSAPRAQ
jgi:hypothetical protein